MMLRHTKSWLLIAISIIYSFYLLHGCGRKSDVTQVGTYTRAVSQGSGYDPAWSPDGTKIAYVSARYTRDKEFGLLLDNSLEEPHARDELIIWDLHTGESNHIALPAFSGCVLTSPVWVNETTMLVLAANIDRVCETRKETPWWDLIIAYRFLPSDLMAFGIHDSSVTQMGSQERYVKVEAIGKQDGMYAVWFNQGIKPPKIDGTIVTQVQTIDGHIIRHAEFSSSEFRIHAGGTMATNEPIIISRNPKGIWLVGSNSRRCLYETNKTIIGIFGSFDGEYVAFLEEGNHDNPGARCDLRIMHIESRKVVTVADDVMGASYIGWSPDGTRIAYVNSDDGYITIVEIPQLP